MTKKEFDSVIFTLERKQKRTILITNIVIIAVMLFVAIIGNLITG